MRFPFSAKFIHFNPASGIRIKWLLSKPSLLCDQPFIRQKITSIAALQYPSQVFISLIIQRVRSNHCWNQRTEMVSLVGVMPRFCAKRDDVRIKNWHKEIFETAMPIYEYECNKCGRQFETLVRADAEAQCPGCGSHALHKQMSAFAVGGKDGAQQPAEEICGRCGNAPGSCAMN